MIYSVAPACFCKHVHSFTRCDTSPVPAAKLLSSSSESLDRLLPVGVTYLLGQKSVVVLEPTRVKILIKLATIVFSFLVFTALLVIS